MNLRGPAILSSTFLTRWGVVTSGKRGQRPATAKSWGEFLNTAIRLEAARRGADFGPVQLGGELGVTNVAVHKWIKGASPPAVLLPKMAAALSLSVESILQALTGRQIATDLLGKSPLQPRRLTVQEKYASGAPVPVQRSTVVAKKKRGKGE